MLWENEILAKFSFLKKYGFGFEFLTLKKDDIVTFNTFVALIYKVNIYFVIKIYINYSFEPICFYKLNGKNEINDIFLYNKMRVLTKNIGIKFCSPWTVFQNFRQIDIITHSRLF